VTHVVPRFYFHIREGENLTLDTDGTELPDMAAVRHEAVNAAKEALIDAIRTDQTLDHQVFEIADERGAIVLRLPFREAVRLTP
jgi:hypothetical protein